MRKTIAAAFPYRVISETANSGEVEVKAGDNELKLKRLMMPSSGSLLDDPFFQDNNRQLTTWAGESSGTNVIQPSRTTTPAGGLTSDDGGNPSLGIYSEHGGALMSS